MKTHHILLLIALMLGATLIGCWTYTEGMYVSTCFAACAVVAVAATFCIKSRRSYSMMEQLLANLRMHDYSLAFHEAATHRDGMWRQADIDALAHDINRVVEQYKQREMEVHTRLRYFETLLGCIDTALIVAKADGAIEWSNRAAEEQLLGYAPRHIDELTKVDATLPEMLREMRPGRSVQLTLHKGTARETRMVADVSIYTTGGRPLHLYALRNIREVLEENEMLSWQKLIRVLTHEIMNSLAPIISLSLFQFPKAGFALSEVTRNLHENGICGIMTDYEEKFHSMGTPINRCVGTKGPLPDVPVVEGLQALLPKWDIHPVADDELDAVLALMESNPHYFELDNRPASMETLLHDRTNLPPRCIPEQKNYVALWRGGKPEALLDLIVGYPRERTLFVGLFMVDGSMHRQGIGREVMTALPKAADGAGLDDIRLGCLKGNDGAHAFWEAMGWQDIREGTLDGQNSVWIMERLAGN